MKSIFVECGALIILLIFAIWNRNYKQSFIVAIVIMSIANIISQIVIAGGGQGACVGVFLMPLLGVIMVWGIISLIKFISVKRNPPDKVIIVRRSEINLKGQEH
jgi:hypothetical protein